MKFVDHSFRIWKFIRSEPEIGIVFLPAVIDHQYARGEPIVNNALRILQNVLLILIIYKLYPRCCIEALRRKVRAGEVSRMEENAF